MSEDFPDKGPEPGEAVLPGEGEQVEVCVNGYWTVIRRGAEVDVPESVYLALGDAGLL